MSALRSFSTDELITEVKSRTEIPKFFTPKDTPIIEEDDRSIMEILEEIMRLGDEMKEARK